MRNKASWLFWIVATLSVAWNAFSVFDYWMTSAGNEEYLREFDPEMIEWIEGFPFWRNSLWAVGVFAGLLGAIALISRRRVSIVLLGANFALMAIGFFGHDLLLANGLKMYGPAGIAASVILIIVAATQWFYAARAARNGYLA